MRENVQNRRKAQTAEAQMRDLRMQLARQTKAAAKSERLSEVVAALREDKLALKQAWATTLAKLATTQAKLDKERLVEGWLRVKCRDNHDLGFLHKLDRLRKGQPRQMRMQWG